MTEKEFAKKFLELVYSNASMKVYKKTLGLNKDAYDYHMGRLEYYNELLKPAKVVAKPKVVEKPKAAKKSKIVVPKMRPLKDFEKKQKKKYDGED